jgi:hypothetical protein
VATWRALTTRAPHRGNAPLLHTMYVEAEPRVCRLSPLEGNGFELPVPHEIGSGFEASAKLGPIDHPIMAAMSSGFPAAAHATGVEAGTESLQTPRWSKADSNRWSHLHVCRRPTGALLREDLPFPRLTDPEAPPVRPERHITN